MKYTLYPAYRQAGLLLCIFFIMACASVSGQVITTYAGTGVAGYSGDHGPAPSAKLDSPSCIVADAAGNVYINDQENSCVRKINTSGVITTIAGTGTTGSGGDGGPATLAKLTLNWGIAVDAAGNVFITDQGNYSVRKVNTSGIINTIAGIGSPGTGGDGGPATAASFKGPIGIAVDNAGNVYIGDQVARTIRKINPAGIITKFAGNGTYGYSGDGGPAVSAELSNTWGLATDAAGNVYICDGDNNCVRKVNTSGIISTVAGNGIMGGGGDGLPATDCNLNQPTGVYVDGAGNIYISDCHNNRIRKVNTAGIIHTIAGNGATGFAGDNGPATDAHLYHPTSVTVDGNNNIYLADLDNIRIRKIFDNLNFSGGHIQSMIACQNGSYVPINSLLSVNEQVAGVTVTWSLASAPHHGSAVAAYSVTSTVGTITPSGLSYTPAVTYVGNDTFSVSVSDGISRDTTVIYVAVTPILPSPGTINGDSTVCVGSSILLTETVPGGIWSISNLNAIIAAGLVTGQSAGMDTIKYTVTNACGTANTTKIITIYGLPDAGVITGPVAFCQGTTITLTDNIAGGVWSSSNSLASVNPASTTSALVTGLAPGIDTLAYTVTDSVCSATVKHAVKIDGYPYAGIITGPQDVCIGSQITITDSIDGGAWRLSNNNASFVQAGNSVTITGLVYGADTASYSVSNSCGTDSATSVININLLPSVPAITFNEGTISAPAGYSSYQWTINSIVIPGATTDSFDVTSIGVYAVTVTNQFGCSASSATYNYEGCSPDEIKVYPNPASSLVHIAWCKKVTVRVLCADGKEVFLSEHVDHVDLSGLPNAVYLLSIFDEKGNKLKTKCITKMTK